MNRIRAILSEFGFVLPTGKATLTREVPLILEDAENLLPHQARLIVNEAYSHLQNLNAQIEGTEQTFGSMAKQHENTKRLLKVRGIGPQTATAIIAAIGDGSQFDNSHLTFNCDTPAPERKSDNASSKLLSIAIST